ncbi:hypothetical protein ONS95_010874 [Cadophora gregata]|uniref:uncharacterized protein n=1 Tax=Cadophora gregata TaxID=51156 RepID=UPI0026DBE894|nr:uncharacterized protein ONS95_010874 [Cadophora gregata]KAK0119422.1 hypothetical protein ONS95_010874 [Cadophora gregata]KAK0120459.1 hypothetical protein ONS96_010673 [Cadophora gregata f. sp. sojae]
MDPSILYQNDSSTVILIDISRSLETAQHLSHLSSPPSPTINRRILSTTPLTHPFPSLEPKTPKGIANFNARLGPPSIKELLLRKHVEFALEEIRDGLDGEEWCLKRVVEKPIPARKRESPDRKTSPRRKKAKRLADGDALDCGTLPPNVLTSPHYLESQIPDLDQDQIQKVDFLNTDGLFFTNSSLPPISLTIQAPDSSPGHQNHYHIPPLSTILSGSLLTTLPTFVSSAPSPSHSSKGFSLITLDPPWPNRSALRSSTYTRLSRNNTSIYSLLSSLPLQNHLAENGVIAVWITNREAFREMVLGSEGGFDNGESGEGGLFSQWGVELVEEWVWVKTTVKGEPIFGLEGGWRKPWEVLLIGRRKPVNSACSTGFSEVKRRIIAGVPDLHSRKPNLRGLFERLLLKDGLGDGSGEKKYEALEIFARNLTAGWWGWGDEVLKFQGEECWVDGDVMEGCDSDNNQKEEE